jgi:hypothetical protein
MLKYYTFEYNNMQYVYWESQNKRR